MKDFRHVLRGHFIEEFENVYTYALYLTGYWATWLLIAPYCVEWATDGYLLLVARWRPQISHV